MLPSEAKEITNFVKCIVLKKVFKKYVFENLGFTNTQYKKTKHSPAFIQLEIGLHRISRWNLQEFIKENVKSRERPYI